MELLDDLKAKGWHFTKEGLETCKEGLDRVSVAAIIQKALNMDMRDFGGAFFPEDLKGAKCDSIGGAGVVQIQKIKNASAPKYEYGSGAPPILRLMLTDGITFVNCLQWGQWKSISLDTPPGSKIHLRGGNPLQNGFLLLTENQFTFLGGCVPHMVEKWEMCKRLASHVRENLDGSGPPPWIPFGKPITKPKTGNFRALEQDSKEAAKENALFKQQRMSNIAEVAKVKEGKPKVFGGGKEIKLTSVKNESDLGSNYMKPNEPYASGRGNKYSPDNSNMSFRKQNDDRPPERGNRNWANEERPQPSNQSSHAYSRDKRPDNRNRYNSAEPHNTKGQRNYSSRTSDYQEEEDYNRKPSRTSNLNDFFKVANRSEKKPDEVEHLTQRTSQIKLHGYDNQRQDKVFIRSKPFIEKDAEVMAKYWEDNKFYHAVIHAVGQEGKTCVVRFLEYGNYEEVLIDDVQPTRPPDHQWNVGPISFQPSHWEGRENSNRPPFKHHEGGRQHNHPRQDFRPSAKLYQPPPSRQT